MSYNPYHQAPQTEAGYDHNQPYGHQVSAFAFLVSSQWRQPASAGSQIRRARAQTLAATTTTAQALALAHAHEREKS